MKKKLIYPLISAILIVPMFVRPVFADPHGPNNIIFTPYGTCTQEFYYDINGPLDISIGGITFPSVYACNVIRYQFTKPTDGVFDLAVTPYTGVLDHQWYLYTTNCYLVSVTQDGKLRFAVEDQEYCEIAIMTPNYNNKLVLMLTNQQLTQSDSTNECVNSMAQYVENIDGYLFNMKADLGTIKNILLNSLGGYVTNNGSLYTDMNTLIGLIQTLNNSVDSFVNIKWNDINYTSTFSNSLNGTYNNSYYQGHKLYVKLSNPSTILYNKNPIYKIRIPIKYISNENRFFDSLDIKVYGITGNNYIPADFEILNYSTYFNYIFIYLRLFNSCYDYVIEVEDPNYNIATDNNTTTVYGQYITEDYVPYWTVFNVLNQNKNNSSILVL